MIIKTKINLENLAKKPERLLTCKDIHKIKSHYNWDVGMDYLKVFWGPFTGLLKVVEERIFLEFPFYSGELFIHSVEEKNNYYINKIQFSNEGNILFRLLILPLIKKEFKYIGKQAKEIGF